MATPDDLAEFSEQLEMDGNHKNSAYEGGGYHFSSPQEVEEISRQRKAGWNWIKSIGSHIFKEGVNLTKISIPVAFFEPRSFLQRCCDNWCFIDLLVEAGRSEDPVDRMRHVVAFVVAGLSKQIGANKPFNPILGETFQARYDQQQVMVCMEQISHHPPISSWEVRDDAGTFTFTGNANWAASTRGNSVKGWQTGTNQVTFHSDHARISWELPSLLIKGIMWGERVLKYQGDIVFKDDVNNIVCKVEIDPKAQGSILRLFSSVKKKDEVYPDMVRGTMLVDGVEVDRCEGTWLTALVWVNGSGGSGKKIWDAKQSKWYRPKPISQPLQSDCRFRQDLEYLVQGNEEESQKWKTALEELQRRDRKMREGKV